MKKFKLSETKKEHEGRVLYRVQALKYFGDVRKGDLGGWIESEENLSQEGTCWVYDEAMVYEKARVYDNAKIWGYAKVFGKSKIWGYAKVFGKSKIWGYAHVYDNAMVSDNAKVYHNVKIYGYASISGDAKVAKTKDYLTIGLLGSDRYLTITKSNGMVNAGCFHGTVNEFYDSVREKYGGDSDYLYFESAIRSYLQAS